MRPLVIHFPRIYRENGNTVGRIDQPASVRLSQIDSVLPVNLGWAKVAGQQLWSVGLRSGEWFLVDTDGYDLYLKAVEQVEQPNE